MKKLLTLVLAFVIVFTSSMAFAAPAANEAGVIADLVILRPLGVASLAGGAVLFVVSLPIAGITKSIDTTAHVLIKEPFYYAFKRPVGEIGSGL